jgi:hypothetical protein
MSTREDITEIPEPPATGSLEPSGLGKPGEEPAPDPTEQWWEQLGEDGKAIREGKKWNDPADLAKGYRAEQAARTKAEQERAALIQYIEALEEQDKANKATAQQAQQPQEQPIDFNNILESTRDPETGDYDLAKYGSYLVAFGARMSYDAAVEFFRQELATFQQQNLQPLQESHAVNELAQELDRIEDRIGSDRFDLLTQRIEELAEEGEDLVEELGPRRAYAEMADRIQAEEARQQARAADGYTLTATGRQAPRRRISPEEAEILAQEQVFRRIDDGL